MSALIKGHYLDSELFLDDMLKLGGRALIRCVDSIRMVHSLSRWYSLVGCLYIHLADL